MGPQTYEIMCVEYAAGLRINIPQLLFLMTSKIQVEFPQIYRYQRSLFWMKRLPSECFPE
jgi:hypothetical protein